MDSKIEDAEKNLGETEIREANLARAEYLSLIGDKVLNIFYIFYSKLIDRNFNFLRNKVWLNLEKHMKKLSP